MSENDFGALADQAAAKYGIPSSIYRSMVGHENGWEPVGNSPKDAAGIVQIHLPSHPDITRAQAEDPNFALDWGAQYLSSQYKRFGTWGLALAAYNAGPGAVSSGDWKKYRETRQYVKNVLGGAGTSTEPSQTVSVAPVASQAVSVGAQTPRDAALGMAGDIAAGKKIDFVSVARNLALGNVVSEDVAFEAASTKGTLTMPQIAAGSGAGGKIVQFAATQIGQKYVWGGEDPKEGGFDCSGLIDWAYRQAGIDLPGRLTSQSALGIGRSVKEEELQSGDMVVSNGGKHVTMYIGGGKVIASPHRGAVVRFQDLSDFTGDIVDVRRVL